MHSEASVVVPPGVGLHARPAALFVQQAGGYASQIRLRAGGREADGKSILARVRAGSAYWNCCDRVSPRLPWSGVGHSGVGLTLSTYGILAFTRPKAWHLRSA